MTSEKKPNKSKSGTPKGRLSFRVRGNEIVGKVVSAKTPKTVTVMREIVVYNPKYERYKKLRSKVHAHNPEWINAKENDIVKIGETRKISKTKSFVVTEILGHAKQDVTHEEMTEGMRVKAAKESKEKMDDAGETQ